MTQTGSGKKEYLNIQCKCNVNTHTLNTMHVKKKKTHTILKYTASQISFYLYIYRKS